MGHRRKPLSGFPITEAFATTTESESYRRSIPLVCLLCGHGFRVLGKHLDYVHGMSSREYCDRYNIRFGHGLSDSDWHANQSEKMKQRANAETLTQRALAIGKQNPRRTRVTAYARQHHCEVKADAATVRTRACAYCLSFFTTRDKRTRYCSASCGSKATAHYGARKPPRTCPQCNALVNRMCHGVCLRCQKRNYRKAKR